jgi:hypothetical protein
MATAGGCGGAGEESSHGGHPDGGPVADSGAALDGDGNTSVDSGHPGGDDAAGESGTHSGEAGAKPDAGVGTVSPGNGCAAALGIDAGFYTCQNQYFVSNAGSDSNSGASLAEARKTIGGAARLPLKAGDCVTVESGTYDETLTLANSGSSDTCAGYVVFRAATRGGAKIVSTDQYQAVTVSANYFMMDGFDIQDTATGSAFVAGTNTIVGGHVVVYHHIAAIRNVAHESGGAGIAAEHADYVRIEGNTVYKNAFTSPYADSGIDLWEAQASDTLPGFHIVIRNNVSFENGEWMLSNPTDGEGILLDSFDGSDPTYGTTPYAQETLVENNVVWGNGGRGIEASGVRPSSYVTFRNNTAFDNNRQELPWPGAEIRSLGNHNSFYNNIAIVGPDDVDGTGKDGLTVALGDICGTQGGVVVSTGSVWQNNIGFSMLSGARISSSTCAAPIPTSTNMLGTNPELMAPSLSATTAGVFAIGPSSPAAHAGTGADYAPFDFNYTKRPNPPSIGAFEP